MTISQSSGMDCYRVQVDYEWATICVQGWSQAEPGEKLRECGEILIHSSFGSWGHQWTHLGQAFKQFLIGVGKESLARKLLGAEATGYDAVKSLVALRRRVLTCRFDRDGLDKDGARDLWDRIAERKSYMAWSATHFYAVVNEIAADCPGVLDDVSELVDCNMPNQAMEGFWSKLWPVFRAKLVAEQEGECSATETASSSDRDRARGG